MGIIDIIDKKKHGNSLTAEEIDYVIGGYVDGIIPDYQISALLMAIYFRGMTEAETFALTQSMLRSGKTLDLSSLPGITIDKHSTGGIGDKVTLILAPLWAAAGLIVAKMSGRGLGHTGGTIDKLESIPGFRASLSQREFLQGAADNKIAITGQSQHLVPADKLLYALRDVTATVDSIPLIASSIMSKKLATGCDILVLDVKYGRGAFMSSMEQAEILARAMIDIGERAGKKTAAFLSPMNHPLGYAVGNSLEVLEAFDVLRGKSEGELKDSVLAIAAAGYCMAGLSPDFPHGVSLAQKNIHNGAALDCFYRFIKSQGGKIGDGDLYKVLPVSDNRILVKADRDGYINDIDSLTIGEISMSLGAGREKLGDSIKYDAGVLLKHQVGDKVAKGDILAVLYLSDKKIEKSELERKTAHAFRINDIRQREKESKKFIYQNQVKDISDMML